MLFNRFIGIVEYRLTAWKRNIAHFYRVEPYFFEPEFQHPPNAEFDALPAVYARYFTAYTTAYVTLPYSSLPLSSFRGFGIALEYQVKPLTCNIMMCYIL